MIPYYTEATIHAFAMVARPIILEYFPPRSCIASTRIALEVFHAFGLHARPISAEFHLHIPSRKLLYLAGVAKQDRDRVAAANTLIELPTRDGSVGWLGHLAAEVEGRWFVDASFDQAFFAFAAAGRIPEGVETPQIAVLDLQKPLGPEFSLEGTGAMEDDSDVRFTYLSVADPTFADQPAWELDHLQPAIGRIVKRMISFLKG